MENKQNELIEIEAAVDACNAATVPDPVRQALVRDLGPVAGRLTNYAAMAAEMEVPCQASADVATKICNDIAADIKTVKGHEVLSKITSGLHDLHRKWTGLRDLFIGPMERDRKAIKAKVIAWQEIERKKAEEIQRKAQAEADAKAARERTKQEAEARRQREIEAEAAHKAEEARQAAAKAKGAERAKLEAEANAADRKATSANIKAEARSEAAASVITPTVTVVAPKSGIKSARAWKVKNIDQQVFFKALGTQLDLCGYVEIKERNMERSKAANPSMEIPGVTFEQIRR